MKLSLATQTLDLDLQDFRKLLERSTDLVMGQFENLDTEKAYHHFPQKEIEKWFDETLPEDGTDYEQLLDQVKKQVLDTATGNLGPHMYAYVMAGGTQVSIVAELMAATINQNVGKWHLGPAINEIEKRVVQWGGEMIGFGQEIGGVLVSGGSAANLAGLTIARNIYFKKLNVRSKGLFGINPFAVYASSEVHGCVDKSLEVLGIGRDQLRKIGTNPDFTIDLNQLKDTIEEDLREGITPFCVIGNAGTVNTGAIDDLKALAQIADEYRMWFHVDGAYGGLAALLPTMKHLYQGIELADSVAIDFHKWLYQPFEAGCVMVKDWKTLREAYFKKADYLDTSLETDNGRVDFNEHYFQLSRNAKSLKIWMSIKAYGMKLIREMIQKDIELTHYLADRINLSEDFEIKSRSELAVVCFRYRGNYQSEEEITSINRKLIPALEKDGRVFITGTKLNDEFVLRACLINHRKQEHHLDYLLRVIREVAKDLS